MDKRPPLVTPPQWAEIGRQMDRAERRAKLDLLIAALLGAEDIAGAWLKEPELRRRVAAATAYAIDLRQRIDHNITGGPPR
jgi:hypothetical protein